VPAAAATDTTAPAATAAPADANWSRTSTRQAVARTMPATASSRCSVRIS
jgi:hypothetical protein